MKTHLVGKMGSNVGVSKVKRTTVRGTVIEEYILFTVRTENDIVTVDRPAAELSRFQVGDRLRHIKGTRYLQACRKNSTVRDCVMCGALVRESGSECPQCGLSLVEFKNKSCTKAEVTNQ